MRQRGRHLGSPGGDACAFFALPQRLIASPSGAPTRTRTSRFSTMVRSVSTPAHADGSASTAGHAQVFRGGHAIGPRAQNNGGTRTERVAAAALR
eukprot:957843-Prymnesium_polylepis.1